MEMKINPRIITLLAIIAVAACSSFIPFSAGNNFFNINPVGAMALFGGAYFSQKWKAFFFPLLALFASDLILNLIFYKGEFGLMYSGWYWIYGTFALIVLIGNYLLKKVNVKNIVMASLIAALAHWLISDFGVWLGGGTDITTGKLYSADVYGLLKCYYMALPYLQNFLTGTVIFSSIMFGVFEFAKNRFPVLAAE